MRSQKSTKMRK